MFKILTYIVLGYFAYRYFVKPLLPSSPSPELPKDESHIKGGDYIDYEEL